jgi:DNA repair exonuclease SbcCD ATPase subunit
VFHLISGALRSISGWMGKFNSRNYVVRTATATIGIRGTDHETRYIPEGSTEGEPGTYDRVYAGETFIETAEGKTFVAPDQAGFQPLRARGKARLLAEIPGFFRPGPHEAQINRKHAEIQKVIDQRREERRKAIAEKRAELAAARGKTVEVLQQNKAAAKEAARTAQEQRRDTQAKREALQQEMKDAQALHEDIQQSRKSLEEVVKTGQITRPELRERRKALRDKEARLQAMQEDIKQKRKELQESSDARVDERFNATEERRKALHDQELEARAKRKSLEEERESAAKEMKTLQGEENKRYREELKADRKGATPPDAGEAPPKQ